MWAYIIAAIVFIIMTIGFLVDRYLLNKKMTIKEGINNINKKKVQKARIVSPTPAADLKQEKIEEILTEDEKGKKNNSTWEV